MQNTSNICKYLKYFKIMQQLLTFEVNYASYPKKKILIKWILSVQKEVKLP